MVNTNVPLSGTLTNTAPSGSASLNVALTSTGTLTVGSLGSSTGAAVAVGTPSTITGSIGTGNTAGTFGWQVTNTDSGAITSPLNISGSINAVNQRTFTSASQYDFGRVLLGSSLNSGNRGITTSGLHAVTTDSTLGAYAGSAINGLTATGGPGTITGTNASDTINRVISGTLSGSAGTLTGTFNFNATDELAGSVTNAANVSYTVNGVNQRSFSTSTDPIALGRFLITGTPTGSVNVSSSGLNAVTANATLGSFSGTSTNGLTLGLTTGSAAFNGGVGTQTAAYTIGGTAGSTGAISGSFSSSVTAELGSISNVTVGLTGTAVATRTVTSPTTTSLGTYHAGASVNVTSNSFGYTYGTGGTGAHSDTEDTTVQAYAGLADANGITLSGALNNVSGATGFTRSFTGTAAINSGSGSFNLTVNPEFSTQTTVSAGYTIGVYSGQMIWSGPGGGSYATGGNWTDSVAGGAQAAPGLAAGFTTTDSATFGNTSGSVTVNLNGVSPSLNAITFNSTGSYTLAQGSGGTVKLDNAGSNATISSLASTHTISAPVEMHSNTVTSVITGSSLAISGQITETGGARSLTKSGGGTLTLTDINIYTGGTFINDGVLEANNSNLAGSATGSGDVTVGTSGTLAGTGRVAVAPNGFININGALVVGSTIGSPTVADFEMATSGNGSTVLGGSSTLWFDLFSGAGLGDSTAIASAADRLKLFGSLDTTLGGTLKITNPTGMTGFAAGDMWTLFDLSGGGIISDAFGSLDYSALGLTSGLTGNFDTGTGVFSITAVPEPSRLLLLGIGIIGLTLRRRRVRS